MVARNEGRVVTEGPCATLLCDRTLLDERGLDPPPPIRHGR